MLPFTQPELAWDFRLSQVRSINVSNHKFGLVYPGIGTLLFREQQDIPAELIYHINYLGGDMPNFSLNFSRPSGQVVAQYYNMLRLGYTGYTRVMRTIMDNARYLASRLRQLEVFDIISAAEHVPVVVVKARDPEAVPVNRLASLMRQHGWVIPAYTLPPQAQDISVLRFVVRENLSHSMLDVLVEHLRQALSHIETAAPSNGKGHRPIC